MIAEKKAFTMRLDKKNYEKFQAIAKKNYRSMAGELEMRVEEWIADYESKNGQISLVGDDNKKSNVTVLNNQVGDENLQVTTF